MLFEFAANAKHMLKHMLFRCPNACIFDWKGHPTDAPAGRKQLFLLKAGFARRCESHGVAIAPQMLKTIILNRPQVHNICSRVGEHMQITCSRALQDSLAGPATCARTDGGTIFLQI